MTTKSFETVLNESGRLCSRTNGCSMLPLIREGRDLVYITKWSGERLRKYDVVFYRRKNASGQNEYVLHRILRVNNDRTYWIVGDNCFGGAVVRDEDILGVMTQLIRRGRTVGLSGFQYKIYVYLWCAPYHIRFAVLKCIYYSKRTIWKLLRHFNLNVSNFRCL